MFHFPDESRLNELRSQIRDMVVFGGHHAGRDAILAESLFYYCCGKDPTPIVAFGDDYPLYVYVDLVGYGNGDFGRETGDLYGRLERHGFEKMDSERLAPIGLAGVKRTELTVWQPTEGSPVCLLYVQGDAAAVYRSLYSDGHGGHVRPRCICNHRFEMFGDNPLTAVEREVEFVMGHCHPNR